MADDILFDLVSKMYSEMQEGFNTVNSRLVNLEKEVKNNSIKLESIETNLNTMAEVQKSPMEQNDKHHTEIVKPLGEKVDIIELSVKSTSKDIQDLKEKFDKVEKVTIQNTYDVAYLKSVK